MSIKENLIALRTYRENPKVGICGNAFEEPSRSADRAVGHILSRYWPHFSGSIDFPVPDPLGGDPAYYYHYEANDKWDETTEYGRLRYEALECLIKHSTELENLHLILKSEQDL